MLVVMTLIPFTKSQETHESRIGTERTVRLPFDLPRSQCLERTDAGMAKTIN
jgi:hypothetical protein